MLCEVSLASWVQAYGPHRAGFWTWAQRRQRRRMSSLSQGRHEHNRRRLLVSSPPLRSCFQDILRLESRGWKLACRHGGECFLAHGDPELGDGALPSWIWAVVGGVAAHFAASMFSWHAQGRNRGSRVDDAQWSRRYEKTMQLFLWLRTCSVLCAPPGVPESTSCSWRVLQGARGHNRCALTPFDGRTPSGL